MGKLSRSKGAEWERSIVKMLKEKGWENAKRHFEADGHSCGYDIEHSSPLVIQAKVGKNVPYKRAYIEARQAVGAYRKNEALSGRLIPVAMCKFNNAEGRSPLCLAILSIDDLLDLVKSLMVAMRV